MWENKEMGLPGQVDGSDYGGCLHSLRVYVVPLKCREQGSAVNMFSKPPPTLPLTTAREEQDSRQRSFVPIHEATDRT